MIGKIRQEERNSMNRLMNEADLFVKWAMQAEGKVPTALFINGADGMAMVGPKELPDERSKDRFANVARLMCVAHGADATVFVSEAWLKMAKPGETLELSKPPSEYADRQETVVILGQTRDVCQQRLLPMIRSETGKFLGFGPEHTVDADRLRGRFANLIPAEYPNRSDRELAKTALRRQGMYFETPETEQDKREKRGRGREMGRDT